MSTSTKKKTTAKKAATSTKKTTSKNIEKEVANVKKVVIEEPKKEEKKPSKTKNIDNIKNIAIIVLSIVVFVGLMFILSEQANNKSYGKGNTNTEDTTNNSSDDSSEDKNPLLADGEVIKEEEMKALTKIDWDKYMDYFEGKTKTIIFLGSDTCGWCVYQKPILQHVMFKYNIDVPYYDVSTMTNDQYTEIVKQNSELKGFGTPTFIFVSKGKITKVSPGAKSTADLVKLLKEESIIK
ncbi:MAG: thioredoxin family protein [Bacilli bacterium]|nr:thioredoxin family protein [Bacilli bacterium]